MDGSGYDHELEEVEEEEYEEDEEDYRDLKPLEEFSRTWKITLEDQVEQLSIHLRTMKRKRLPIVAFVATALLGHSGWFHFSFVNLPYEMELIMTKIPLAFLTVHWYIHWKLSQRGLANVIYLPPNMNNPDHRKYPDKYTHIVDIHQVGTQQDVATFSKTLTNMKGGLYMSLLTSMGCVFTYVAMNPSGDPMLGSLSLLDHFGYSMFPLVPYAFTLLVRWAVIDNVKNLGNAVFDELENRNQLLVDRN